jgi:DNA topoisomerase-3
MIVCACGYREKYAAFEKRKQAERDTLSKRDVQTYLENQNKQERAERNNPFAALKGMKFE